MKKKVLKINKKCPHCKSRKLFMSEKGFKCTKCGRDLSLQPFENIPMPRTEEQDGKPAVYDDSQSRQA